MHTIKELNGAEIVARDGAIGSVDDVYFDDERWAVRYLVVDTGNWLPGRKVLISPASVPAQESSADEIRVALTREEVRSAPDTSEDPPISRLLEAAHARHYRYPYYWGGPYLWGAAAVPLARLTPEEAQRARPSEYGEMEQMMEQRARESHVRSGAQVLGYSIRAADGELGHVEDFLIDDENWAIAGMVVDTRNWLPGKKVLVPPEAISSIDWSSREVRVRLKRAELERAPEAPH
jgi:uncharacterized protein YrrD